MTPTKDANGDHVCEHGTAMDVHCCHCHSGFIFDKDHECPEDQTVLLRTSTGVMLTVERYNDLLEGERGMWKTLKQWRDLISALKKIRDTDADPKKIATEACAADFDSIKLHEAYDGETRSLRTELAEAEAQITALRACADALAPAPTDDFDTPEDPQRTLDSLAAMLGWGNTPPRRVLEQEIKILRERVAALDAALKNKG